jgi:SARP family transcriptional regulator, regulator of embCAB operon
MTLRQREGDVITVQMFGPLTVRVGGRALAQRDLGGAKPRQLLQLLLVHQRSVTKDELIDHLWGDRPPRDPIATLEAYVSVLRSNLQPGVRRDDSVIATEAGAYRFVRERAIIDVDRFEALVRSLPAADAEERRLALVEACSLAMAPLLQDERYAEWVQAPRRHYDRLRLETMVAAAELHVDLGAPAVALDHAEQAMLADPSCEAAYHVAMTASSLLGRRDMVARFYQQCERALRIELDVPPMAETTRLRDHLLADERRLVGASAGEGMWMPAGESVMPSIRPLSRFR